MSDSPRPRTRRLLSRPERSDWRFLASQLRTETVGGAILLVAAAIALIWANSPFRQAYRDLADWVPFPGAQSLGAGPVSFHLDLSLSTWAADGLLAIFFFVVGLELKRELIAGSLSRPAAAALPITAAIGGMVVPAGVFVGYLFLAGDTADLGGWGVPVATDIAFALAVLAVLSSHLPSALRVFLLTLAVVDDLLAIIIIAIFYTADLQPLYLLGALVPLVAFAMLVQRRITSPWLLVPLALVTWLLVHESGVHATIAGVALGLVVPVARTGSGTECLAERFEHAWRPVSAGFAIPVFAFFGAGAELLGPGFTEAVTDPPAVATALGLVLGKPIGVLLATWLVSTFTRAELDPGISWRDMVGLGLLTGIGFTVSLLITELAFAQDEQTVEHVRVGVILGSVAAAVLASIVLSSRNRAYRRLEAAEAARGGPEEAAT